MTDYETARQLGIAEWVLTNAGFRRCDIPACNCGSWHQVARYDAMWDTGDPLSEAEQTRRGQMLADTLQLRKSQAEPGRYCTDWGTKTALGLYRTVKRILEEGK